MLWSIRTVTNMRSNRAGSAPRSLAADSIIARRIGRTRTLGLAAAVITVTAASSALAQGSGRDPGAADVLFREGRKAMQAGSYAVACPKFHESYRLDPAPGTLLNLGDCQEKLGHLASAWQFFREAEQRLGGDERAGIARQRWATLEGRLAFVTFNLPPGAPPGARVLRDDVELGAAGLGVALPLDPGRHVVRVRAPGRTETALELQLASGERRDVALEIGRLDPAATTSAGEPRSAQASDTQPSRALPWIAFGVAGAGLLTTGIGAWQVLEAKSVVDKQCTSSGECDPSGLDAASNGRAFSVVGTIGGAVFIAGAAAGTYLLLTPTKKAPPLRAGAGPIAGGLALSASGSF